MATTPLPAGFDYGLITGQYMQIVGDSTDLDRNSEGMPHSGLNVAFALSSKKLLDRDDKVTFLQNNPIVCTTDVEGFLIDKQGARGVYLVATDLSVGTTNPTGATYSVTITQASRVLDMFDITVPAGSEQDLATIAPVPSSNGASIVIGPTGPGMVVVSHGTDANVVRPVGAAVAYWIGTATPINALAYDLWYDA